MGTRTNIRNAEECPKIIKLSKELDGERLYEGKSTKLWKVVEVEPWIVEGETEFSRVIVSPVDNLSLFYCINRLRNGSYNTLYHYDIYDQEEITLYKVKEVIIETTKWIYE